MYLEDLFGLKGKVAVVTGGARGTGKVVAQGLAKAGAKVAVLCRSGADETVSLIEKEGGEAVSIVTDVSVEDQVKAAYAQILDRWGSLDIVFNNAAIGDHKSSLEVTVEEFRKVVDVNLTGEFIVAREAARIMVERGIKGSIINMASMSGTGGMATKLNAAQLCLEAGVDMVIANGARMEALYDIVEGKNVGTRFSARRGALQ